VGDFALMPEQSLEDEIKAILAAAHDKGAEAVSGETPLPEVDPNDPAASHVITALITTERTWTVLLPIIHGFEEALIRLAREIDQQRNP
jgi:hypothetical protein